MKLFGPAETKHVCWVMQKVIFSISLVLTKLLLLEKLALTKLLLTSCRDQSYTDNYSHKVRGAGGVVDMSLSNFFFQEHAMICMSWH